MIVVFLPSVRLPFCRSRFGFYGAFQGCRESPFPTFFLVNYSSQKEEFSRNALQNDGTGRDSPPLHRIKTDRKRHEEERGEYRNLKTV